MKIKIKLIISLILLCTLLYSCVSYPDLDPVMKSTPGEAKGTTAAATGETEPVTDEPAEPLSPTSAYKGSGIFESDTGTTLVLRLEWEAEQDPEAFEADVTVRLYLEYQGDLSLTPSSMNTLTVGGEQITFPTEAHYTASQSPVMICEGSFSLPREDCADMNVRMVGKVYSGTVYEEYEFKSLTVQGNLNISDKYADMPESALLDVNVIGQMPELPNGCEVTSLAMVLNYHGYNISKMDLKNGYLPIGSSNIYEYNIGDPAERKDSYGCYSPVIKRTADAYFADKGIERTATDLTHCNVDELYYQVSEGKPVIVWATQDMSVRPHNIKSWEIDGLIFNWKAPLHCMVLVGYDMEAGTVTIADPLAGTVTHDMTLFETRWHQMGEQAVML